MNNPKHFVIYAMGTGGDIDPMVALATELVQRGHRVSFLSNDYFAPIIQAAGCEFVSVGTVEQYHQGNSVTAWERDNQSDNFQYYHAPAFEPAFRFVQACSAEKNCVVLVLGEQNGAAIAAEKYYLPFIKLILSPNAIFSAYSPPAPMSWVLPKKLPKFILRFLLRRNQKVRHNRFMTADYTVDYLKVRKRLDCWPKYQKKSKAIMHIAFFPEWFGMPAKDWPTNLALVGFPLQNRASGNARNECDQVIESLGNPLVFTTGTGVKDAQTLFREGRKICEQLQLPGLFVGGAQGAELLQGSELCVHIQYVDFEYLLPKSLAIIHHGGIGTTAQAIKAGIPQLIRPLKFDQPDNADRVYRLGLGTYVLPEKFSAEVVTSMVRNMLQRTKQSKALKKFSADVRNSDAIITACDLIEEISPSMGRS